MLDWLSTELSMTAFAQIFSMFRAYRLNFLSKISLVNTFSVQLSLPQQF